MQPLAFGLGAPMDIAIVAAVVVLLFGGPKVAEFGRSLGQGIKEFKKAVDEDPPAGTSAPPPAVAATKPAVDDGHKAVS